MKDKARKPTTTPGSEPPPAEMPELPERWSVQRKTELVLRLLRGEALDAVSRESQVPAHELESWKRVFLEQGTRGLKTRTGPEERDLTLARAKIGELMMRLELAEHLIHAGRAISEARDVGGFDPVALQLPNPAMTANVTFLAAEKFNGTYLPVYGPTGVETKVTTGTTAKIITLTPTTIGDLDGLRYLKLRSGTEASPVNQTGDRIIQMLVRQGA